MALDCPYPFGSPPGGVTFWSPATRRPASRNLTQEIDDATTSSWAASTFSRMPGHASLGPPCVWRAQPCSAAPADQTAPSLSGLPCLRLPWTAVLVWLTHRASARAGRHRLRQGLQLALVDVYMRSCACICSASTPLAGCAPAASCLRKSVQCAGGQRWTSLPLVPVCCVS